MILNYANRTTTGLNYFKHWQILDLLNIDNSMTALTWVVYEPD